MSIATEMVLSIMGQDKSAAAFSSVAGRANKVSSHLRKALGFAVAGLSVAGVSAAVKSAVDGMGTIADAAQQAGVSSEYLQKLSMALDQVGIKGAGNVETLASAFLKMAKNSGATGAAGFESTLASVAAIGDEGGRIKKLAEIFGKDLGANLAPLVRQGPDAFREGLKAVMASMPAVSDKAVEMGDTISDAIKMAGAYAKTSWREALGSMAAGLQSYWGMPLAEGLVTIAATFRWAFSTAWLVVKTFYGNCAKVVAFFRDDWKGALEWVWNGFKGYFQAIFAFVIQWYKSMGNIALVFGKELWSAIKGDGFNWDNISAGFVDEMKKVGAAGKDVLASLIPSSNDKIKFDIVDWDSQFSKLDQMVAVARNGVRAQKQLANGGITDVVESEAEAAVKTIKDAMKDAAFTEVGTYDALKLMMSNRGGPGVAGVAMAATYRPNGAAYGTQRAYGGDSMQVSLLQRLASASDKIEAILQAMRGDIQKVEAV